MTVTSKDGHFYYKASPKDEMPLGTTCGLFLITDPERQIEIELLHVDVSCEEGGLVSVNDKLVEVHQRPYSFSMTNLKGMPL